MKKFVFVFLILVFVVSACTSTKTEVEVIPTITISPTVTYTSTPNITPLPTIPTFTPTFDVSKIITVTPATGIKCSEAQIEEIINSQLSSPIAPMKSRVQDITNDGVADIIIENQITQSEYGNWLGVSSYICINNEYIKFDFVGSQSPLRIPYLANIEDLNKNDIPEIITVHDECWGMGKCEVASIFEWKNTDFKDLSYLKNTTSQPTWGNLSLSFKDVDNNGTIEILYREGPLQSGDTRFNGPFRPYTETYTWNGEVFTPMFTEMSQPIFRFQAIDDADQMSIIARYNQALLLYEEAINKTELLPYSFELAFYYREQFTQTYDISSIPTPNYELPEYPGEYSSLASYAYYRIMLLQLVQGQETEANQTYQTLQNNFGNDIYAKPYIEMATKFLQAYQVNQKMYDGCTVAIQYAVEHPEILVPLGSDYHGWQSKDYKPEDICPFR